MLESMVSKFKAEKSKFIVKILSLHTDLNRSPNEGLIRVPDRHALFPYLVESNKNARIKSIAL